METKYRHPARGETIGDDAAPAAAFEIEEMEDAPSFTDYLELAYRRRWWIACTMLVALALGVLYTVLQPKVYQARSSLLISAPVSMKSDDIPLLTELQALKQSRSVETLVEVLSSRDLLNQAFAEFPEAYRLQHFGSTRVAPGTVAISAKKNTDVIQISVNAYSGKAAVAYGEKITAAFFARDLRQNQRATRQARQYVEENLGRIEKELHSTSKEVTRLKREHDLVAPQRQLDITAEQIGALRAELTRQRVALAAAQQYTASLKKQLEQADAQVVANTVVAQNPRFAALREDIDQLYSERARLLQTYTAKSAEVRALDDRIKDAEQRLADLSEEIIVSATKTRNPVHDELIRGYAISVAESSAAESRIASLQQEITRLESVAEQLPELERKLSELTQRQEIFRQTSDLLTRRLHTLLMSEESTLPNAWVLDEPWVMSAPVSPRPLVNIVMAFIFGVLAATLIVMLVERLDDRIHEQEAAERLTGMMSLTRIPMEAQQTRLVDALPYHSDFVESFRILRNNISFMGIDEPLKCLAVLSSGPSEGKSTTVANLAAVFAQEGKRVLIIDCDLHRPNMHTFFGLSPDAGLTNVLVGSATLETAICETGIAGVSLLPTGPVPPNPTEVLNSQQNHRLIRELAGRYDVVLLDCPPCLKMSDVQIIATMVDALLFVVALERTQATSLRHDVRELARMQAPLAGLVINYVDMKRRWGGTYRYSKYYYGYSHGDTDRETAASKHD